jgi:hypothetical protein
MLMKRPFFSLLFLLSTQLYGQVVLRGVGQAGIPLGQGLTPPPSTSKPEDRCVLQGRVSNAITGEPVRKATIRLMRQMTAPSTGNVVQGQQGYATTSQPDGSFRIENLEPGNYHLSGERTGYLNTEYGAKSVGQRGSTITLRPAQQLTNINLALTPQAVISGKVVDQDGDPVEGVQVQLVGEMWQRGKLRHMMQNGANTNDLGEYRIANIRPGKYYLVVQRARFTPNAEPPAAPGQPDIRPARTYYPEAATLASATPLDVKAGQDLAGTNIRLRDVLTYHIRGRVVGAIPEGPNERLNVNASSADDVEPMMMFGGGTVLAKDHTFDIPGVAPGSYTLTVFATGGQVRSFGRQDVEVGQGDVNDVQISVVPPGALHGQVIFEGNPQPGAAPANLKNVRVFISPAENTMVIGNNNAMPSDDGTFSIENVMPGKYYLNANTPAGTYLKSVRFGNQEVAGKELDLSQGSGQIAIVFSYGVAEVDGTVQLPQSNSESADGASSGQPNATPDASIVLVPDRLNDDGSGLRFSNSGAGGSFTMKNVPPGHYRAYALERMDYNQLQNPDVLKELQSKGTDVELKENDRKQIQLPLISIGDMQQIYTKLGIEAPQE